VALPEGGQLDIAKNRGQQIVEIVSNAAGELTDHLELLGLAQALLHLPPLGHIPDRAGEAEGVAALTAIETTFSHHPAYFVIGADKAAFEAEFSGSQCLLERRGK